METHDFPPSGYRSQEYARLLREVERLRPKLWSEVRYLPSEADRLRAIGLGLGFPYLDRGSSVPYVAGFLLRALYGPRSASAFHVEPGSRTGNLMLASSER